MTLMIQEVTYTLMTIRVVILLTNLTKNQPFSIFHPTAFNFTQPGYVHYINHKLATRLTMNI